MDKEVKDLRTLLQGQKRPEQKVQICLRGDLTAEIVELDKQLVELQKDTYGDDDRFIGKPNVLAIADQIKALQDEAREYTVDVLLRAMPKKDWQDLTAKHPGDKDQDFDPVKVFAELVPLSIVNVNGAEIDPETRDKFLDGLTEGQFDQLAATAWTLNAGEGRAPFSVLASRALRSSDATSKPPATSE